MVYIDRDRCVPLIGGFDGPYGYQPSLGASIAFCVLFGLAMVAHVVASIRYRVWWQMVFAVGAVTEVIGWAGRTLSSKCPYQTDPFLLQIVTLVIAPTFFTAGIYVVLGRLIRSFGDDVSIMSANQYLYMFCTVDLISLVIQAIGGALAAIAYEENPPADTTNGTRIMIGGIVFQLGSIMLFCQLFGMVIHGALKKGSRTLKQKKVQAIIAATVFGVVCIVIRSIYRTIELLQGWTGYLITRERFFVAFDGVMMLLVVVAFLVVQPKWSEIRDSEAAVESEVNEMTAVQEGDGNQNDK